MLRPAKSSSVIVMACALDIEKSAKANRKNVLVIMTKFSNRTRSGTITPMTAAATLIVTSMQN